MPIDKTLRPADHETELRDSGLRVTAARLAVLDVVTRQQHADADDVLRATREALGSVSVQAVYDVLNALTDHGLLRRIAPAGHPARYERRQASQLDYPHRGLQVGHPIVEADLRVLLRGWQD